MSVSGYDADPADREFDRLLEDAGRAGSRGSAAGVSDKRFESLLRAFRSLDDPAAEAGAATERTAPAPSGRVAAMAEEAVQAWRCLVPRLSAIAAPDARGAIRRMECAAVNLQLAQHAGSPHAVLAVNVARQPFALPLDRVVETFRPDRVRVERDGVRAWAVAGAERLPLCFLRQWLVQGEADETIAEDAWIVAAVPGGRRAGLVVDGVEGVVPAAHRPSGPLLRGARGVTAVAAAGERLLPLLDPAALLEDDKSG
jgi:hypothetical protein